MNPVNESIQQHYTTPRLDDHILAALEKAGKDITRLTPEDLAPVDEFHIRGREATLELANAVGLDATQSVLDVGSGLGGTSRCLAERFGCRVLGIDLTDEYCRVAEELTKRTGLSDRVGFRQGDALDLPFADASFDVVWSEHAAMNIPDKARLYSEMFRVLKPGGTLALHDILMGSSASVVYPVPWARTPDISFLVPPDELRRLLDEAGFRITDWSDTTEAALAWFTALAEKLRQQGPPPLGYHLLMGADFPAMVQNQRQNLEEGRIALIQVIATKA